MRRPAPEPPLSLEAGDLDAARLALAPPKRRRARARRVLVCAGLMMLAALALCAVVLGGWSPQGAEAPTEVRAPLAR